LLPRLTSGLTPSSALPQLRWCGPTSAQVSTAWIAASELMDVARIAGAVRFVRPAMDCVTSGAAGPSRGSQAHLVLVAGDDDRVWPSARFVAEVAKRAALEGSAKVQVLIGPGAGWRGCSLR
jgi:hypothetical protein